MSNVVQPGDDEANCAPLYCDAVSTYAAGDPRRYFELGYTIGGLHTCIMKSPNGIAVICLAPDHPVLAQGLKITSIDFKVIKCSWLLGLH